MSNNSTNVFSFDEEVPSIDDFQYRTKEAHEPKLINNRVRADNESLFGFAADIDLSEEYTSDGKKISDVLNML
ncbi:hypothetical protein R83H12_02391 [Fibrobacteria bacterium R8-3-H12]